MSDLLWIAAPGGFEEHGGARRAVLRVLVVPRLDGGSLAAEGLQAWPPEGLVTATLAVDFAKTPDADLRTVSVPPPHVSAQPGLWDAFFGPRTTVKPARPDAVGPEVEVAKTSEQAAKVTTTFGTVARANVTLDPASHDDFHRRVREQLGTHWTGDGPDRGVPGPAAPQPALAPPDFHRTLSLLREHPAVLRGLGLIVELRIEASALPAFSECVVRVDWPDAPAPPALPKIVSRWTRLDLDRFLPASTENISAGMVALTDDRLRSGEQEPRWGLVTVDVDVAERRLRDAARALVPPAGADPGPASPPAPVSLPALRTAGLVLLRRDRAQELAARRKESSEPLTADDLVLGYRIDVKTRDGEWRSLHRRKATYFLGETTIGEKETPEEGHLKANAAVRHPDGKVRADETVARWTGWSLAVPQPTFDAGAERARPARRSGLPFELSWRFEVPKHSLLPLRFGETYFLRARVADVAGGGLALGDQSADRCELGPVLYGRHEPVASPVLLLPDGAPARLGPGESVDHVVIRSDRDQSVAAFAAANPRYVATPGRALQPPRTTFALARQHPHVLDGHPEENAGRVRRALAPPGGNAAASLAESSVPDPAAGGVSAFRRAEPGVSSDLVTHNWHVEGWPELGSKTLELLPPEPGKSPLVWEGDRLSVRLAPAEQVTLELSSFLRTDFLDHFEAGRLIVADGDAAKAANLGRHPLVTPAAAVTLVHAVRKPLADPEGDLKASRGEDQTFATLEPQPELTFDGNSTARLEITAAWTEPDDERTTDVTAAPVQSLTLARGQRSWRDPLRHEFGDTRHRRVTYTLTAVSRFRQFFDDDEDAKAFVAQKTLAQQHVPSSARPAPLTVLSTVPSFDWGEHRDGPTVVRERHGGRLRVELERPWFRTGEGELLAVVVWKDDNPPPAVWPFVSQAGRDPIWDTPGPARWLTPDAFFGSTGRPNPVLLEEAGAKVELVPYEPWFRDGRWYADVVLPGIAAASYFPFVQLALARYQPSSLADHELSQIVHTPMVPLLPHRTLTVEVAGSSVAVTLKGRGPDGPRANRVDATLEECILPAGMQASAVDLVAAQRSEMVPAWVPVSGASTSGTLEQTLRVERPASSAPLRVRVREVEQIGPGSAGPPPPGTETELAERTVFTDMVLLGT